MDEHNIEQVLDECWARARFTVLPDFRFAPDPMFDPPGSWLWPDNAWQREHQGWALSPGQPMPVSGWPLPIAGHEFWRDRRALRREIWWARRRRNLYYGGAGALYCFAVIMLVALLFQAFLGPLFAGIALLVATGYAVVPSLLCVVYMLLSTWLADVYYVRALRRSDTSRRAQFLRVLVPVVLIQVLALGVVGVGGSLFFNVAGLVPTLIFVLPFLPVGMALLISYLRKELGFEDLTQSLPNPWRGWSTRSVI